MVGARGFEPPTSWSRTRRSSQAEPRPDVSTDLYIITCPRPTGNPAVEICATVRTDGILK